MYQNISLVGCCIKLKHNIKVEKFLKRTYCQEGLSDKMDNNYIKIEEFPWWQLENTDEHLLIKEETSTHDNKC